MPINQLEIHPYLNYRESLVEKKENYTGLIIGSFPIYACSNLLNENLELVQENNFENQLRFRFFYGSKRSEFWDYFFKVFENNNPITIRNCISLLEDNYLLISDILYKTNRINQSSADGDLFTQIGANDFIQENLQLNEDLINLIEKHKSIKNLFFTAQGLNGKTPFGWFRTMFENLILENLNLENNRFNCVINNRKFNVFLLPTPKPRGIHFTDNNKNLQFCNYIHSVDLDFYNLIIGLPKINRTIEQNNRIKELRINFLIESYRQAIIHNNLNFNGTIENVQ